MAAASKGSAHRSYQASVSRFDRTLATFDIRNVFHFSGGYQLPFGRDKQFLSQFRKGHRRSRRRVGSQLDRNPSRRSADHYALPLCNHRRNKLQRHQCCRTKPEAWTAHRLEQENQLVWQPGGIPATLSARSLRSNLNSPAGCIPSTGSAILGGNPATTHGPPLKTFDFSVFKAFQLTERFSLQFRSEFFNIFNHPNFNAPNFGGNGVVSVSNSANFTSSNFGEIGSTRTNPRQVQFALKLFY